MIDTLGSGSETAQTIKENEAQVIFNARRDIRSDFGFFRQLKKHRKAQKNRSILWL